MKIAFIRHGESEANVKNEEALSQGDRYYTGQYDAPLTSRGMKQAEKLYAKIDFLNSDGMYSSNLQRAIQTATIATKRKDIIVDPLLIERGHGVFEGKYHSDVIREHVEFFAEQGSEEFVKSFVKKAPGGENYKDVQKRAKLFFNKFNLLDDKTIVIFSHNCFIKNALYILLGSKDIEVLTMPIKNCEVVCVSGSKLGDFNYID